MIRNGLDLRPIIPQSVSQLLLRNARHAKVSCDWESLRLPATFSP
jgi:hypothetical protein